VVGTRVGVTVDTLSVVAFELTVYSIESDYILSYVAADDPHGEGDSRVTRTDDGVLMTRLMFVQVARDRFN